MSRNIPTVKRWRVTVVAADGTARRSALVLAPTRRLALMNAAAAGLRPTAALLERYRAGVVRGRAPEEDAAPSSSLAHARRLLQQRGDRPGLIALR